MELTNWSRTLRYGASLVLRPTCLEEVVDGVAGHGRVRALGTRHSFSSVADTDGTLIDVTGLPFDPVIDADAATVTVGAGSRFADIALYLQENGWALHNMGSLPHIAVAGAAATGTHGSGNSLGILGTAVRGLELVTADGDVRQVTAGQPGFDGMVVGLGAFGIVTRVTLAIEPSYAVQQDVFSDLPWDALIDDPWASSRRRTASASSPTGSSRRSEKSWSRPVSRTGRPKRSSPKRCSAPGDWMRRNGRRSSSSPAWTI